MLLLFCCLFFFFLFLLFCACLFKLQIREGCLISRQLIRQTLETALVAARQGRHSSMTSQCMPGMGIDTAIFKLHRYIQVIVPAISWYFKRFPPLLSILFKFQSAIFIWYFSIHNYMRYFCQYEYRYILTFILLLFPHHRTKLQL